MIPRLSMALVFLLPATAMAGGWASNPGMCSAHDAEQELAGLVWLTERGFDAHGIGCYFSDAVDLEALIPGKEVIVDGRCDDGAETWQTKFSVTLNEQARIWAYAYSSTGLPEFYFDCDKWGYKGD